MSYEEVGIRLRADGGVETLAGVELVGAGLEKMGRKAEQAVPQLDRVGKTAKETAQAMRLLPAQITDVVTSLASGQPAWLVAIQQGGQIKDSFGGAVPAAHALAGAVTPLNVALGGTAIVATAVTAAWFGGRAEMREYEKALLLTGGAASATAGALDMMARRTAEVTATQAKAAEVLAQMAATGQISRAQLQQSAEAAIRMERMLGVEVEKTVGAFAQLGRDPVQGAARLNQQYNFLTLAVWEQIRALDKQGRTQEAAAVAQEAFAKTGIERAKQMERNLGFLETGWMKITDAAKGAWDAMLGVGRQQTVEAELADVQARLAAPLRRGVDPTQQQARREGLRQREAELQAMLQLQQRQADMQAAAARKVQEQIEEDQKKDRAPKPTDPYQALNSQISQRLILASAELEAGTKLTAIDRERMTLAAQIADAERKGDAAGAQALRGRADVLVYLLRLNEERRQAEEDAAAVERQFQADRQQAVQLAERELLTTRQQLDATMEDTAQIGLNAQALAMRAMAQMDSTITDKEARLARIEGLPAYAEEAALLQQQIQLMRQLRDARLLNANARAAADEQRANKDRADGLAQSIEQGLLNGFRNGQSYSEIFLRELKAQFARTVLRAPIQFVAEGTNSAISQLVSFAGQVFGGGGSNVDPQYQTGLPMPGFDRPGEGFHEGGVAGYRPTFTRMLPASTWNGAMRRHGGGLAADEVPAILKRKEGVFTEDQMKALAPVSRAGSTYNINLSPTFNVDARSDRAEVMNILRRGMEATKAELLDDLQRRTR